MTDPISVSQALRADVAPPIGTPAERLTDEQLRAMPAPANVSTALWNASSVVERRQLLAGEVVNSQGQPVPGGVALGTIAIPLSQAGGLGGTAGASALARALARFGVFALPLFLAGDTPQPRTYDMGGDLRLTVSADGSRAWFQREITEWNILGGVIRGTSLQTLDVPVRIANGQLSFDADLLARSYGQPLPDSVLAMAARPAGVSNPDLQTTNRATAAAMAGAPDPCRNLPGQRHHIIPAQLMARHESFLTQIGFRLDDPNNLVRLPSNAPQQANMQQMCGETRPTHTGSHGRYTDALDGKLSRIEARFNRGDISAQEAMAQVRQLMSQIRAELSTGSHATINSQSLIDFINRLRF